MAGPPDMKLTPSSLAGAAVVDLERIADVRGYFGRVWLEEDAARAGYPGHWVVTSMSYNARAGTLRGMHTQRAPHAEIKLVRCIRGAVFDVMLDLRPDSPTYLRWHGEELSSENQRALYIPAGCAHGFLTLTDDAEVFYQLSQAFAPQASTGVRFDDPAFGIRWPRAVTVINQRDRTYPDFGGAPADR